MKVLFLEYLLVLLLVAFVALSFFGKKQPRRKSGTGVRRPKKIETAGPKNNWGLSDPKNQLEAISKVNFERTRLLNKSEARVLKALEGIISDVDGGLRVMAQTSLGELIKPSAKSGDWKDRKNAYASINSKRLDFAIVDRFGLLVLAVEYQGSGHHQGKAFMRDAVKKEALRRAKVPLIEVEKGTTPKELSGRVKALLPQNEVAES